MKIIVPVKNSYDYRHVFVVNVTWLSCGFNDMFTIVLQ